MRHHRLCPWALVVASMCSAASVTSVCAETGENRNLDAGRSASSTEASLGWLKVSSPSTPRVSSALSNTQWRLVEFQSTADGKTIQKPEKPGRYVLRLDADGTATLWVNCHRVTLTWVARPPGQVATGSFEFGRPGQDTGPCPTPGIEQSMLRHVSQVRTFALKQGRLQLGSMTEGAVYVWSRDSATTANIRETPAAAPPSVPRTETKADAKPGGRPTAAAEAWQVTRRVNLREQPSTQSKVLAVLNPGTRLARGACQPAEGREWCRVTVQQGAGEGFVAAEYLVRAR